MRILQINSAANFGGGERHFVDLCRGLSAGGNEIFVALRKENNWRQKLSYLPEENIFYLPLKNSFDLSSAQKLAKIAREQNIEIVHAHLARDYAVATVAARIAKKPKLVLTRHLLFPLKFAYKFILPADASFIAVSNGVCDVLLKQNILPSRQIHLIYNGVDSEHFARVSRTIDKSDLRRRLNLKSGCRLIGIAGEITAHKGQSDFVRAAPMVLKRFPDAEFLIAGQDGSPEKKHLKNLKNLIESLKLENKIHLLGWTDDVATVFSALDVFVSASRAEPFGLVIAEAMASGCAVVATETDGALEIIETGETGKLVPVENPARLAEAIAELLGDENLRRRIGDDARKAVRKKFGIDRMIGETERLYRQILAAD